MPFSADAVGSGFLTTLTPPPPDPDVSAQPVVTVNSKASAAICAAIIILVTWPMATSLLGGSDCRNSPPGSFLEQGRSDHETLDFARPFVDFGDLGVPVVPFGREVGQIAVAAEDLQRFLGDAVGHLGVEQLGHRGVAAVTTAPILGDGGAPEHETAGVDLGPHVGELELDRLMFRDGLAEGLPFQRVVGRVLEGGARDAERLRRHADAPAVERAHSDLETIALGTEARVVADRAVGQEHLRGARAAEAELVVILADLQA